MKSEKELADQLDAEKRLREHGYRKTICYYCEGSGFFNRHEPFRTSESGSRICPLCSGKGYKWEAPLVR